MEPTPHTPLFFQPVYKKYIWGGNRFRHDFHRPLPPGTFAESWEISTHPDGPTPILTGPDAGRTLTEAIAKYGPSLLGPKTGNSFPLLIKLIDAAQTLSVQVHPSREAAARFGGEAKNEMWFVLAATPDAHIYSGFQPGTTEQNVRAALASRSLPQLLQRFPVSPGMVFHTPGGRVHAIGAGCLLLEIQQDANTTYRLYDWDRLDHTGKPRPLHIEQAIRVIDWTATASPIPTPAPFQQRPDGLLARPLLQTPAFHIEQWQVNRSCTLANPSRSFLILFALSQPLRIHPHAQPAILLPPYTTCLIPAALPPFRLSPQHAPPATLIATHLPT